MTEIARTETLLSSVIVKTIVPLHRERFVVVHLYSSFSTDPQDFPLWANLYQKLPFLYHFWRFCGLYKPTFTKPEQLNLTWVRTWVSLLHTKFCMINVEPDL